MKKSDYMVLVCAFSLVPQAAYAYIDPGTGSYVIQIILAFAIGGAYSVKLYWKKLTEFFRSPSKKEKSNHENT